MIGRRDNSYEYHGWVAEPYHEAHHPLRGGEHDPGCKRRMRTVKAGDDETTCGGTVRVEGNRGNGKSDEEGVAEVERWHSSKFIGKTVVSPDRAFASWAVDSVNKAVPVSCVTTYMHGEGELTHSFLKASQLHHQCRLR